MLLYTDDIIIIGDYTSGIVELKKFLSQLFELKNLCFHSYFLGLKVSPILDGYYLSQAKYASDLSLADLTDCKMGDSTLKSNVKLLSTDGEVLLDANIYRQ